ncbi:hypothetical protein IJG79_02835 [Candidatus Saccharibacteria bacterium]|nr:hypothetical protein [Candidatus Saccharibacteria bacterium]
MFNNIKNFIKSEKKLVIIAIIFLVLVAIIITIIGFNTGGKSLKINNLSDYKNNIPNDIALDIQSSLYNVVKKNTANPPTSGAMVREGSFLAEYDSYSKTTYISFLVDIKKIQQSYLVQYEKDSEKILSGNVSSTSVVVSCIYEPEDIIYKDFKCKDEFSYNPDEDNPYQYIGNAIPFSLHLESDYYITITPGETESDLVLNIDKCDTSGEKQSIQKVKEWIESLYINPDLFTYHTVCKTEFSND